MKNLLVQDSMHFDILVLRLSGTYNKNDKSFGFFVFGSFASRVSL